MRILFLVSIFCSVMLAAFPSEIMSLECLCAEETRRIERLFAALELTHPGLEAVRTAAEAKDWPGACTRLVAYYRDGADLSGPVIEQEPVETVPAADAIASGTFTFYNVPSEVPRTESGGLDWTHQGPTQDREWAWALNRHGHLGVLLRAYERTGRKDYVRLISDHLTDWVINSPYPERKSNTAQWRGLEAALRIPQWARLFTILQGVEAFDPVARILLLSSLPDHAHYLRHFHAAAGNWVTMEMNGLAAIALGWPEFREASAWLNYAVDTMTPELTDQVYPDGAQMELTSHYHGVAARNFQAFADRLRKGGRELPALYTDTLERMWNYWAYTMRPNGYGILNNDSDYDFTRAQILAYAVQYQRPDWTYIASNGTEGIAPEGPLSVFFPWAGQAILRDGYGPQAQWTFFDAGPLGTGHIHRDMLHLSVQAFGRDILVDTGRYTYVGGPWRDYFTNSSAHNVVLIDGKGQRSYTPKAQAPLENSHRFTPEYDFVRGAYTTGFGQDIDSVAHTRAVFYARGRYWLVVDKIQIDRPCTVTALWHYHPECTVTFEGHSVSSIDTDRGNIRVIPLADFVWDLSIVKGQTEPEIQGWYSPVYNQKVPAPVACFTAEIPGTQVFAWLLLPARDLPPGGEGQLEIIDDSRVALTVSLDGVMEQMVIPLEGPLEGVLP